MRHSRYVRIDYDHGVVRRFTPARVRSLFRYLGIPHTRAALREATRTWAESL